jgi:hypothetical protein
MLPRTLHTTVLFLSDTYEPHNPAKIDVWCCPSGAHLIRLTPAAGVCCLSCGLPPASQALLHALSRRLPCTAGPLLRSL